MARPRRPLGRIIGDATLHPTGIPLQNSRSMAKASSEPSPKPNHGRTRGASDGTAQGADGESLPSIRWQPGEAPGLYRLLVESVLDYAIFALDATGHIRTWNAGAERIKGYTPDEIIGKHFSIFYPP